MKKIFIILVLILSLTSCNKKQEIINDKDNIDIKVDNINKEETKEDINITNDNKSEEVISDNTTSYNKDTFDINDTSNINTEDDVVTYFDNLKLSIKDKINNDTWDNTKEYISQAFKKMYGFCFKGEKIGNYTLSELSNTAKEKVIGTILEIDSLIEAKVPGYKDDFKESYNVMIDSLKTGLELLKKGISNIFTK